MIRPEWLFTHEVLNPTIEETQGASEGSRYTVERLPDGCTLYRVHAWAEPSGNQLTDPSTPRRRQR